LAALIDPEAVVLRQDDRLLGCPQQELEPVGEDCYNVDARMSLTKLERTLSIAGPEEEMEVETIGGWVLAQSSDGLVRVGASYPYGEATVTVTEMAGRRVRKVKVCVPERDRSLRDHDES